MGIGSNGDSLTVSSSLPSWSTAGSSGSWAEVASAYDTTSLDTGFISAAKNYRWLDFYWTGEITSGSEAPVLRYYSPDGSEVSNSCYGLSGMNQSNTLFTQANSDQWDIANGASMSGSPNCGLHMTFLCSPIGKPSGGMITGTYQYMKRLTYDCTFTFGNIYACDGFSDVALQFACGIKTTDGNSYDNCMWTLYGAGSTSS